MIFDLCDECIAKHGPFKECEPEAFYTSRRQWFCHGCQQAVGKTTPVGGSYNPRAVQKLREDLDQARDDMEEKIKLEAREDMDRTILAGLEVTQEQVDGHVSVMSQADEQRLKAMGAMTPSKDGFYAVSEPEVIGSLPVKELDHYKIQNSVGWDANGSPTEEWP